METSERLVDEGQRLCFSLEKERIIVPADFAVESRKSFGSEIRRAVGVKRWLDSESVILFSLLSNIGHLPSAARSRDITAPTAAPGSCQD